MQSRGMYFSDYLAFLRRNATPHARINVMMMGKEPFDMATLVDEHKHERHYRNWKMSWNKDEEWIATGSGWTDYLRYCFICNVGWDNGEVPYIGGEGIYDDINNGWIVRPMRGLQQATHILVAEGCLRGNKEVANMCEYELGHMSGKMPPWCRHYV